MVNDIFNEQLVARKPNKSDSLKKAGIAAGGVALILGMMFVPALAGVMPILSILIIVGIFFLVKRFNIEYEYVFTNGDLDIDKITNKSKRKNVLSIKVSSIEVMVPVMKKEYAREVENFQKLYDFSSGVENESAYAAIVEHNGQKIKIIIEPNQKMFDAIRSYIPRKIKK